MALYAQLKKLVALHSAYDIHEAKKETYVLEC